MNEDLVYNMIKPYIKEGAITYTVFFNLFGSLRKNEQYQIIDLFESKFDVRVVDDDKQDNELEDLDIEPDEASEKEFEVLYDKGIFANDLVSELEDVDYRQANETLCRLMQEGNEAAKTALCVKNKRLVYKYAFAYNRFYGNDLDMEDLAQAGFLGLIKGAERFDLSKGNTFSTYAVYWIKQSITRELIDKGFTIRLPVHIFEKISKVVKLDNKYDALGYTFDRRIECIADEMGASTEKVLEWLQIKSRFLTLSSLDTPVGENEETPLSDFIEDDMVESADSMAERDEVRKLLDQALSTLKPREEKVLRLRYGFDDGNQMTLEAVGKILGVTRERVRQIEAKALRNLSRKLKYEEFCAFFE